MSIYALGGQAFVLLFFLYLAWQGIHFLRTEHKQNKS